MCKPSHNPLNLWIIDREGNMIDEATPTEIAIYLANPTTPLTVSRRFWTSGDASECECTRTHGNRRICRCSLFTYTNVTLASIECHDSDECHNDASCEQPGACIPVEVDRLEPAAVEGMCHHVAMIASIASLVEVRS